MPRITFSSKWTIAREKCCAVASGLLLMLASSTVQAQVARAPPMPPKAGAEADVSVVDLSSRIEVLKTRTDLSDNERGLVLEQLRAAVARAEAADVAHKSAGDYAAALQSAPDTIAALTAESASTPESDPLPDNLDMVAMQLRLAALQAESVSLHSKQRTLLEQLRGMDVRPTEARAELANLRKQLNNTKASIPANASPLLIEAGRLLEQAAHKELSARIEKTEQELLSLPTRKSIATAQSDLLARRIAAVGAATTPLDERIASKRKQQADEEEVRARAFERSLAGQPVAVREFASATVALRTSRTKLSERLDLARETQNRSKNLLSDAGQARKSADQILAIGSISDQSAALLRGLQKNLVSGERIDQRIAARNNALVDLRVQQFQTQAALRTLQQSSASKRYLAEQGVVSADTDIERALMGAMVESRSAALSDLADTQDQLISVLSESSALDTELMQVGAQIHGLLDERLLWLPSTAPLGANWFRELVVGTVWLFKPANWALVPPALSFSLRSRPLTLLLIVVTFVALLVSRKRLVAALQTWARPVGHRTDSFHITLLTSGATLLLALTWPLAIASLGWSLSWSGGDGFVRALAGGTRAAALVWLMLGLFINMCRPHGLFDAHFGWDALRTQRLDRALRQFLLMLAPTALLVGMTHASEDPELIDGLGRLSFLLGSLAMALFIYRVFHPNGDAPAETLAHHGTTRRMSLLWSRVLIAVPLLLAALASVGYYATARELEGRLLTSGWIFLAVAIVYSVAMRGVLVASRRAAWQQADARYAKALAEAQAATTDDHMDSKEALVSQNQESGIDAVTVSQQTHTLLRAASAVLLSVLLVGIWRGMIPALNVFNDVVLWSHVVTGGDGASLAAVTLGDVLMSLLTLGLTAIAARTLPGFVELMLMQRSGIDSGTRYAVATIARYAVLAIGLLIAFSGIGADWSKLQWVVAALGVGLGFGLQEIVANFISGLIILFERPVRVGDLVTIGETCGTVSRIKIRAITITNFDNFEVLVPNKAFITETVQNWTLSNEITRLLLKMRIAHGSDVQKAQQLMLDVATAHPLVLTSPEPSVMLLELSESAMEFEMRAYVARIDDRLPATHALYTGMIQALSDAAIEIPFPQRDINVRHIDPGNGVQKTQASPPQGS